MNGGTKTCGKCGVVKALVEFYPKRNHCKACVAERNRRYTKNRGKRNERSRLWREAHPEEMAEHSRAWKESHPEEMKEFIRRWKKAHPEKVREYQRKCREANREAELEYQRRYREVNREALRERDRLYRETNREAINERRRLRNGMQQARRATRFHSWVPREEKDPLR
jgi:ABC-type nitrate/sulfonate/bicarbonate transport system substrate-binding protein